MKSLNDLIWDNDNLPDHDKPEEPQNDDIPIIYMCCKLSSNFPVVCGCRLED